MEAAKPSLWMNVPGMYGVSLYGRLELCLRAFELTRLKGFVLDLDPDAASLQVVRVSNAFPRTTSVHTISVDGVVDIR